MDYKEALFKIVEKIADEWSVEVGEELTETVFNILEELDDQKSVIDFATYITNEPIHKMYPKAIKFLLKKANITVPENESPASSLIKIGLENLKKKALESIKSAEKPEVPRIGTPITPEAGE